DSCVAEAVNKGLEKARAPIIRVLGDDDEVLPGGIGLFVRILNERPEYDVIAGHNIVWLEEPDGSRSRNPQERFCGAGTRKEFVKFWARPKFIIPEVCFFRKSVFDKVGGYETSLRWFGFLDHFFRVLSLGLRLFVVPVSILNTYHTLESDSRANALNPHFR